MGRVYDLLVRARGESSQAQAELAALSKSIKNTGRTMTGLGKKATIGLTVPIVAAGTASFNAFAGFDKTIRQVGAVADDVSRKDLERMRKTALKLGRDTSFSAQEAATAMLELAKGGISQAQMGAGVLQETLTLAAAGGLELGSAAGYMTNTLNAFGLKAGSAGAVAAALAGGANASTASVESLGQGLAQVSAQAKQSGLSMNETIAALAAFDQAGVKGSDAGTSLKTMLQRLVPQTDRAKDAMKKLGVQFTDAHGDFLPMRDIAQQLQDGLGKLGSESERTKALVDIFGSDASRAAGILGEVGAKGIDKFTAATKDAAAAQELAKTNTSGASGAIERAKGAIETAAITWGQALAPAVVTVANAIGAVAGVLSDLPSSAQTAIAVAAGLVAAIGPLLLIAGQLTIAFGALLPALAAVTLPMVAIPVAIAAVVVAIGVLIAKSEAVRAALGKAFAAAAGSVKETLGGLRATMSVWAGWARALWARFGGDITDVVASSFGVVASLAKMALGNLSSIVNAVLAVLRGDWRTAWSEISEIPGRTLRGVADAVRSGVETIGARLRLLKGVVSGLYGVLYDAAKKVGGAIIDGIVAGVKAGAGAVRDAAVNAATGALDAVKKKLHIASPSRVFRDEVGAQIALGMAKGIDAHADAVARSAAGAALGGLRAAQQAIKAFNVLTGDVANTKKLSGAQALKGALAYSSASGTAPYAVVTNSDGTQSASIDAAAKAFRESRVAAAQKRIAALAAARNKAVARRKRLRTLIPSAAKAVGAAKTDAVKKAAKKRLEALRSERGGIDAVIDEYEREILELGGQINEDTSALQVPDVSGANAAVAAEQQSAAEQAAHEAENFRRRALGLASIEEEVELARANEIRAQYGLPAVTSMSEIGSNPTQAASGAALTQQSISGQGVQLQSLATLRAIAESVSRLGGASITQHVNSTDPDAIVRRLMFITQGGIARAGGVLS